MTSSPALFSTEHHMYIHTNVKKTKKELYNDVKLTLQQEKTQLDFKAGSIDLLEPFQRSITNRGDRVDCALVFVTLIGKL